jgi:RNA polymerase sigma-70 factor (ECF subfamily)
MPDPDPDRRTQSIAPPSPDADCRVPVPTELSAGVVAEFTTFYKAALPRLVAFLRWQGASLPDAADCAQESFAACFQQ